MACAAAAPRRSTMRAYGREDIVAYLVDEEGADINAPGEQGYTAFTSLPSSTTRLVQYLLERGARTDMLTRDEDGARAAPASRSDRTPNGKYARDLRPLRRRRQIAAELLPARRCRPTRGSRRRRSVAGAGIVDGGASPARAPLPTYGGGGGGDGATYQPAAAAGGNARRAPRPALARGAEPTVRIFSKRPRGWSTQPNAPLYRRRPAAAQLSLLQKPPTLTPEHHAATHQGPALCAAVQVRRAQVSRDAPRQAADAEAALIRARSRGQRASVRAHEAAHTKLFQLT